MSQTEAIEIEGEIEVVGVNLPQNMEQDELLKAQQSKISDVLVVLERHHAKLEQALSDGIAGELPDGVEAKTTLSFAETGSGFNVNVTPVINGEARIDRRRLTRVLPEHVASVMSDCIGANSTRVGVWEPKVVASIKGKGGQAGHKGAEGQPSSAGLGHIGWVLGIMGIAAGAVAFMLMR